MLRKVMKRSNTMFLSVITVVLNCVDTIERTIKSVINQPVKDIEYIVIDGGSTDGTLNVIKKYSAQINYWISEPDKGLYHAMNKGIKKAAGEWVAFMNADDWYEPSAFLEFCAVAEQSSSDIIYGKVNKFENGIKTGYLGISQTTNPEAIHGGNIYCHQGLFIKRKLFEEIGLYDCQYKTLADYDWILKAHNKGITPEFADFCVANFTMGGISSSKNALYENRILIQKNYTEHVKTRQLKRLIEKNAFEYFYVYNCNVFADFIQNEKQFYIWGMGVYGIKCFNILNKLECQILGFIDSNSKGTMCMDKNVFSPMDILLQEAFLKDENTLILIATEKYEEEIKAELKENAILVNKYISIGNLFKLAMDEYMKPM